MVENNVPNSADGISLKANLLQRLGEFADAAIQPQKRRKLQHNTRRSDI
jgi:hypothetical protein